MVVRCLLCRTTHKSLLEPFIFCWGCLTAVGAAAAVDSGSPQVVVEAGICCFSSGFIIRIYRCWICCCLGFVDVAFLNLFWICGFLLKELVVDDDGCFGVGAILMVLWQQRFGVCGGGLFWLRFCSGSDRRRRSGVEDGVVW
jgi:hypothetical protein